MDFLWHSVFFILLIVRGINSQTPPRTIYDFEDPTDLGAFSAQPLTLTTVTSIYKNASHSMEWRWASRAEITHSICPPIQGSELTKGGIKLWLYITHRRAGETLTVSFADQSGRIVSQFHINLNFTGWRAVWVSYRESLPLGSQLRDITTMKITAPPTTQPIHPLYFDQLRLVGKMRKQTRDKIVPPIMPQQYSAVNNWQQTYNWSQVSPPNIPSSAIPDRNKLDDLTLIEKRLDNWFVKQSLPSTQFGGNVGDRWISLQKDVEKSHRKFNRLNIVRDPQHGVITGPPLYSRDSEFRNKTFSNVMKAVLLPMALDYHIRSRQSEVNAVAAAELQNLIAGGSVMNASIQRIAGDDAGLQQTFNNSLGAQPYDDAKVRSAIQDLNDERKRRLELLLDYIENQGFTDGSGLGSLNHEMNKDGAGFMNSVYLLRNVLQGAGKTSDYIATMKWYNEFGEVYQNPFPYTGTNTDRMRTISIFRLFTVLMMPTSSTDQKLAKIRDMEALVNWSRNALAPNEAFGGVLKPDYLGFHHGGYYASAYTPNALHKAALIQYLLSNTSFQLDQRTVNNLKKGLEIMRVVSVKYSSPNSVSGRFPEFFRRKILAKNFPAYAYIAATAPNLINVNGVLTLGQITNLHSGNAARMFLRLNDTGERAVKEYLRDGRIFTSIYYLNSIGSISIMEEVYDLATRSFVAEPSPKGFWALNYAALAIHRREDWAVSVKGFNKFVWDFEASTTQNCYGLYQSHGALLIANSEAALEAYDIENGWDWTRHPGTTTIKMDFDKLVSKDRRYFQPKKLAGGVRLVGAGQYATGAFGMEFSQPSGYRWQNASAFQRRISFTFQKSVFFADSLIVCLGSDINTANSLPTNITQTTLFQTKQLDASSVIYMNTTSHSLTTDIDRGPSHFGTGNVAVVLTDVNGNGYYIPKAGDQGLNVKISNQTSRNQNGTLTPTYGRYSTAWLNHGVNPSNEAYEYAIIVNKSSVLRDIRDMLTRQQGSNAAYRVLHRDSMAHVIKFPDSPRVGVTQYGYVFFDKRVHTPGPVKRVSKAPCLVMVEKNSNNLYISVSSPDLNFNITQLPSTSPKLDARERFYSVSRKVKLKVVLRRLMVNVATGNVKVNDRVIPQHRQNDHVEVVPESPHHSKGKRIRFKDLKKGYSTEVQLTIV